MSSSNYIKQWIIRLARRRGYDIVRYSLQSHSDTRFIKLLSDHSVNVILDIGANTGQYGDFLRSLGYRGKIISFEPLSTAFADLREKAQHDRDWVCEHVAIGATSGRTLLHVAANSQSSSILEMLPQHSESAPSSRYIADEEIELKTVDAVVQLYCRDTDRIFLKVDTQGYERRILEGARNSFPHIKGLELEMSMVPLYKGETLFHDMVPYVGTQGFTLMSLEPVFFHPHTGQLLQVNGIFFRTDTVAETGKPIQPNPSLR